MAAIDERKEISHLLNQPLSINQVRIRPGPGGKSVAYMSGHDIIEQANQIFGFDGWSSEFKDLKKELERGNEITYSVTVTVKVGSASHQDIGWGTATVPGQPAQAMENASKAAITDGVKRALRLFGNAVGNGLYNKEQTDAILTAKRKRSFQPQAQVPIPIQTTSPLAPQKQPRTFKNPPPISFPDLSSLPSHPPPPPTQPLSIPPLELDDEDENFLQDLIGH
jgi:DNA repair and recombination protein RAD52